MIRLLIAAALAAVSIAEASHKGFVTPLAWSAGLIGFGGLIVFSTEYAIQDAVEKITKKKV